MECSYNQLTSLDVSNNTNLDSLRCDLNQLTSLDVSQNIALEDFRCKGNQLSSLDLSSNTLLYDLDCDYNNITSLNLSNNTMLYSLNCMGNQLMCLNLKNGNISNLEILEATDNPNLTCIEVDDADYSNANWLNNSYFNLDDNYYFSNDCDYPAECGSTSNCDDLVVSDTTEFYVSSTSFQSISPEFYLADADTFVRPNNPDCDSIVYRYTITISIFIISVLYTDIINILIVIVVTLILSS